MEILSLLWGIFLFYEKSLFGKIVGSIPPTNPANLGAPAPTAVTTDVGKTAVPPTATISTQTRTDVCLPNSDWPAYTIQAGDTMASLARRVDSSIDEIAAANCLDNPNLLHVGQILHLPRLPAALPAASPYPQPGTATPTPDTSQPEPRIHQLTVTTAVTRPAPGDTVTLTWEAEGSNATLCAYYAFNSANECVDVPLQGSHTFTLRNQDPVADHWVDFRLEARHAYQSVTKTERLLVACHNPWFQNGLSDWCPTGRVSAVNATVQSFENGLIIVTANVAQIFFDDAAPACRAMSGLMGITADIDSLSAPDGRYPPDPHIAPLWLGNLRGTTDIQTRLGWAITPPQPFTQQIQCERTPDGSGNCFVTSSHDRIYIPHTITGRPGADGLPITDGMCTWFKQEERLILP